MKSCILRVDWEGARLPSAVHVSRDGDEGPAHWLPRAGEVSLSFFFFLRLILCLSTRQRLSSEKSRCPSQKSSAGNLCRG